ncbi:protein-L-isoaspartate O-methyltransferase family protein [Rhizorhabdus wittichii]|uniref:Protein-L-isoaspartate O-methyltransferase n=2 Tax=Rhizorhabdus wittichii TaxID=160791 RepID=A0A9J9H9J4_RHIWR|nr:protein-L-isoaspartate O-methyltransferase [Rhizorhabdus wittichii]ABQ67463.1 protein-L-isoaspartate(D-aspartate) O-methyltransferase [Rhizorhabdus wittichii RW1]QTH22134.1 protein-L-isoaspartate O-methyltransferase [Rhizorhabdus wittichii]
MTEQNFEQMRHAMVVSQLRTTGVSDARVVAAMGEVARERFVGADKAAVAYADLPLPIAPGRALNPPMVTGRLLTQAQVAPGDSALVVGAATGYTAALLERLGASVVAVEEDADLLAAGKAAVPGATWIKAAPASGSKKGAPYSLIVIDGAVEQIPQALIDQLADGGRLVGALIDNGVSRLVSGVRVGGGFGVTAFADADAATLPGFGVPAAFSF